MDNQNTLQNLDAKLSAAQERLNQLEKTRRDRFLFPPSQIQNCVAEFAKNSSSLLERWETRPIDLALAIGEYMKCLTSFVANVVNMQMKKEMEGFGAMCFVPNEETFAACVRRKLEMCWGAEFDQSLASMRSEFVTNFHTRIPRENLLFIFEHSLKDNASFYRLVLSVLLQPRELDFATPNVGETIRFDNNLCIPMQGNANRGAVVVVFPSVTSQKQGILTKSVVCGARTNSKPQSEEPEIFPTPIISNTETSLLRWKADATNEALAPLPFGRVVLLGGSGAGKSTFAKILTDVEVNSTATTVQNLRVVVAIDSNGLKTSRVLSRSVERQPNGLEVVALSKITVDKSRDHQTTLTDIEELFVDTAEDTPALRSTASSTSSFCPSTPSRTATLSLPSVTSPVASINRNNLRSTVPQPDGIPPPPSDISTEYSDAVPLGEVGSFEPQNGITNTAAILELVQEYTNTVGAIKGDWVTQQLQVWDFGSQELSHHLDGLFLSSFGDYVVVFNMRELLDAKTKDQALERINFWLRWIRLHTGPIARNSQAANCSVLVLLGTHKDEVENEADHFLISEMLKAKFRDTFSWTVAENTDLSAYPNQSLCFFPVSNSPRDGGIVRDNIIKLSANILSTHGVPLPWLNFMDQLRFHIDHKWITFEKAYCLAQGIRGLSGYNLRGQVEQILKLMHGLMLLIWHPEPHLKDFVVLDPSFLVDAFGKVIFGWNVHNKTHMQTTKKISANDLNLLQKQGLLTIQMLRIIWDEYKGAGLINSLLGLMIRYGLVVQVSPNTYLVPSLLPKVAPEDNPKNIIDGTKETVHEFFVAFFVDSPWQCTTMTLTLETIQQNMFIPPGLFLRLVGQLVGWTYATCNLLKYVLSSQCAAFAYQDGHFIIEEDEELNMIRVRTNVVVARAIVVLLGRYLEQIVKEFSRLNFVFLVEVPEQSPTTFANLRHVLGKQVAPNTTITLPEALVQPFRSNFAGSSETKYDFFISYRWEDKLFGANLAEALIFNSTEGNAISVFIDDESIPRGVEIGRQVMHGVFNAKCVVAVVSVSCFAKLQLSKMDYVLLEWTLAVALFDLGRVKINPIFLGRTKAFSDVNPQQVMVTENFDLLLQNLPDQENTTVNRHVEEFLAEKGLQMTKKLTLKEIATKIRGFKGDEAWKLEPPAGLIGLPETCASILLGQKYL